MHRQQTILGLFQIYYEANCTSKSEVMLCKTILENMDHLNEIDSKTLAKKANVSTATITRFIKHFPTKSYKEFAHELTLDFKGFITARQSNLEEVEQYGIEGIFQQAKIHYTENLKSNHFKDSQILELIQRIKVAKSVTFIGADRSLAIFNKVQLALITLHKPAYIFKQDDMLTEHLKTLTKEDLVIFISLENRYMRTLGNPKLSYITTQRIPCVMLSQIEQSVEPLFQQTIYFGKNHNWNYGYYSLNMLANYLEHMILIHLNDR